VAAQISAVKNPGLPCPGQSERLPRTSPDEILRISQGKTDKILVGFCRATPSGQILLRPPVAGRKNLGLLPSSDNKVAKVANYLDTIYFLC